MSYTFLLQEMLNGTSERTPASVLFFVGITWRYIIAA